MKLTLQSGSEMFIADDSPNAVLINAGHTYSLDAKGQLVIGPVGPVRTLSQLERAVTQASSVEDLKAILLSMIKLTTK